MYLLNSWEDEAGEVDRDRSAQPYESFRQEAETMAAVRRADQRGAKNGSKETSQETSGWSRGETRVVWTWMAIRGGALK